MYIHSNRTVNVNDFPALSHGHNLELNLICNPAPHQVNEVTLITDKITGRSKGFAYVEMRTLTDVPKALALDGEKFEFRNGKVEAIRVILAHGRGEGAGGYLYCIRELTKHNCKHGHTHASDIF